MSGKFECPRNEAAVEKEVEQKETAAADAVLHKGVGRKRALPEEVHEDEAAHAVLAKDGLVQALENQAETVLADSAVWRRRRKKVAVARQLRSMKLSQLPVTGSCCARTHSPAEEVAMVLLPAAPPF